jgi:hypothetical protein
MRSVNRQFGVRPHITFRLHAIILSRNNGLLITLDWAHCDSSDELWVAKSGAAVSLDAGLDIESAELQTVVRPGASPRCFGSLCLHLVPQAS